MSTIRESKLFRAALASVLAFTLMLTMTPLMPIKQAEAILPPPPPEITIQTATYYFDPDVGNFGGYVFTPGTGPGSFTSIDLGGAGFEVLENDYVGVFWNNGGSIGPVWRVTACTRYVDVNALAEWAVTPIHQGGGGLTGGWASGQAIGFRTLEEGVEEDYMLYVAEYDRINGATPLWMGLNTESESEFFGNGNNSGDVLLSNVSSDPNEAPQYPRAVLALNPVTETIDEGLTARDFLGEDDGYLAPIRYLEGGNLSDQSGPGFEDTTWGRRFPQRVIGLYIATPA